MKTIKIQKRNEVDSSLMMSDKIFEHSILYAIQGNLIISIESSVWEEDVWQNPPNKLLQKNVDWIVWDKTSRLQCFDSI